MTGSSAKLPPDCSSGIPILILGLIAIATGVRHDSAWSAALGMSMAFLAVSAYVLAKASLRGVEVTRVAPESAFEGDTVQVEIRLTNRCRFPIFFAKAGEVFSPEVHAEKIASFPYRIGPGETATEVYRGDCILPRGIYSFGPTRIAVSDPLGWFRLEKDAAPRSTIKVYPRFQRSSLPVEIGECVSYLMSDMTRYGIGDSNEFFAVREYRLGDSLRHIHWGLTAHRGYPVVKEHTRTARGDLCIVLDLYRFALLGVGRGCSLEASVKMAASIASSALERGHKVHLLGRGFTDIRVSCGKGGERFQAILDALVEVKPEGTVPLDEFLARDARQIAAGSIAVIMVHPYLEGSETFEKEMLALRRRGVRVLLVVFDKSTFHSVYENIAGERDSAEYAQRLSALGMEAFLVPCAAEPRMVFSGGRIEIPRPDGVSQSEDLARPEGVPGPEHVLGPGNASGPEDVLGPGNVSGPQDASRPKGVPRPERGGTDRPEREGTGAGPEAREGVP